MSDDEEEPNTDLKVGDEVRILNSRSTWFNKIGTIRKVHLNGRVTVRRRGEARDRVFTWEFVERINNNETTPPPPSPRRRGENQHRESSGSVRKELEDIRKSIDTLTETVRLGLNIRGDNDHASARGQR